MIEIAILDEQKSGKTQGQIAKEAGMTATELSDKLAGRKPFTDQDILDLAPVLKMHHSKLMGQISRKEILDIVVGREKKLTQHVGKPSKLAESAPPLPDYSRVERWLTPVPDITEADDRVSIPIWPERLAASPPASFDASHEAGVAWVPKTMGKIHGAKAWAVEITGDSMSRIIDPADVLFVRRSSKAKDGDIVIAALDGGVTVKRLEGNKLVPESDTHKTIDMLEDCKLLGVAYAIHKPAKK